MMTRCKLLDIIFNLSFHLLEMWSEFHDGLEVFHLVSNFLILDVLEAPLTDSWHSLTLLCSFFIFYVLVLANYLQLLDPLGSLLTVFRLLGLVRLRQENVLSFCVTVEVWSAVGRGPHIVVEVKLTHHGCFFRIGYHWFYEPR